MDSSEDIPLLTVTQLTNAIKTSLESTFPQIWLQGEISNLKLQSSGHLYFSLKDAQAQIAAVMFRGEVQRLIRQPKEGAQAIVKAELNVYPPSGKYQLIVREMRLAGIGELLMKLEELKVKLLKKGWFKAEHKKKLPRFPKTIGVVTSPTGAVIQDIIHVLSRRFSGFKLILNPVRVQGEGAAQEIAQAIDFFNRYPLADVLIVGRGGGSIEDLWAFNEEIVAEAIFRSRIPIISAVGHETDHCIADYVADVRAPTPSAAAEIAIAEKAQQLQLLSQFRRQMENHVAHLIKQNRRRLEGIQKQPLVSSPYALLGFRMQRLDDIKGRLEQILLHRLHRQKILVEARQKQILALKPTEKILHFKEKIISYEKNLQQRLRFKIQECYKSLNTFQENILKLWVSHQRERRTRLALEKKQKELERFLEKTFSLRRERLSRIEASLQALNPRKLLTKGYCILFSEKKESAITSIQTIKRAERLRVVLSDGELLTAVEDIITP